MVEKPEVDRMETTWKTASFSAMPEERYRGRIFKKISTEPARATARKNRSSSLFRASLTRPETVRKKRAKFREPRIIKMMAMI